MLLKQKGNYPNSKTNVTPTLKQKFHPLHLLVVELNWISYRKISVKLQIKIDPNLLRLTHKLLPLPCLKTL